MHEASWTCWIPGTPVPKARPRFRRLPGGQIVTYTPARSRAWECHVAAVVRAAWDATAPALRPDPVTGLALRFFGPERADIDNLAKAVMDALHGVLYVNDRAIRDLLVRRRPAPPEGPGVTVTVWRGSQTDGSLAGGAGGAASGQISRASIRSS